MRKLLALVSALLLALPSAAPAQILGLGHGLGFWHPVRQVATYDAAATALFAAMTTPPTDARKSLINSFIVNLKNHGVWSKLDAIWFPAAADSQAATLNWKAPATYTLTPVNSPTFTADRGYAGDGSTSYVDTNFIDNVSGAQWSQNSATIADYVNSGSGANYDVGVLNSGATRLRNTTGVSVHGGNVAINAASRIGFTAVVRPDASTLVGYYDSNAAVTATAQTSQAPAAFDLALLRYNTSYSANRVAFACAGGALSATDVANLYAAVLTYLTAIGAN